MFESIKWGWKNGHAPMIVTAFIVCFIAVFLLIAGTFHLISGYNEGLYQKETICFKTEKGELCGEFRVK